MTIDETIKHYEYVAEEQEWQAYKSVSRTDDERMSCEECAKEHRQLVEWLKELKKYRAIFKKVGESLANNEYTIDDLYAIYVKTESKEVDADDNT